ncbi:MAG: crossover junction endodeoxyribonuclease RuvC [Patescibacteria group bacterium]
MKVLGLDVSSAHTGVAISSDGYLDINSLSTIDPPPKLTMGQKLVFFKKSVKKLIKKHNPDIIIIEDCFRGPNAKTFKVLSMWRGVIFLVVQECIGQDPISIMPSEARKAVGAGITKENAFEWVIQKYDFKDFTFDKHNDICDAIILSLSYFKPRPEPKPKKKRKKKK